MSNGGFLQFFFQGTQIPIHLIIPCLLRNTSKYVLLNMQELFKKKSHPKCQWLWDILISNNQCNVSLPVCLFHCLSVCIFMSTEVHTISLLTSFSLQNYLDCLGKACTTIREQRFSMILKSVHLFNALCNTLLCHHY